MVMVPVLVVMSGALAFSAFSGTATTNVSATAGYLSWEQTISSNYTYHNNTKVTSSYPSMGVSTHKTGPNATDMEISVNNLAPGNWVEFNVTITNTGSVGLMLSGATITTTELNGTTMQRDSTALTNDTMASTSFMYGQALGGTGYLYNVTEVPSGSIDNGGTATYQIFLGLGSDSGNAYQESMFTLNVGIIVTSDP